MLAASAMLSTQEDKMVIGSRIRQNLMKFLWVYFEVQFSIVACVENHIAL